MNEFLEALFGWLVFNFIVFSVAKNKVDAFKQKFEYKQYGSENWDNWVASLLIVPALVWYMDDICSTLTWLAHNTPLIKGVVPEDFTWPVADLNYWGSGPLTELVYFGIEWLFNRKATLIKWVHKDDAPTPPPAG